MRRAIELRGSGVAHKRFNVSSSVADHFVMIGESFMTHGMQAEALRFRDVA
jgi:hypothetical protein